MMKLLTQTKYTGTVENLADILDHGLTPLMFHQSSHIQEYAESSDTVKR